MLLLAMPVISYGKEYITPNGTKVNVPEPQVEWKWREGILPSGLKWIELIPIARASTINTLTDDIKEYIRYWAEYYSLDASRVLAIAICESRLDPKAYNDKDIYFKTGKPAKDPYRYGLFQFSKDTFKGEDIWDWRKQTEQATALMAKGYWLKWGYCNAYWEKYD